MKLLPEDEKELVDKFQKESGDKYNVLYGGDGTLAGGWSSQVFSQDAILLPIRNYGRCETHEDIREILRKARFNELEVREFPIFVADGHTFLSEFQLKSADISQAMRFDIEVNGKTFAKNVIADGIVAATSLGATGYFKSITRTVFRRGWGLAIVNPTYSIVNQVLSTDDRVKIIFRRECPTVFAWDKDVEKGEDRGVNQVAFPEIEIKMLDCARPKRIAGYDIFMCSDCRKSRNSSIVNDQYIV